MEDYFRHELVRPVPRRKEILRHDPGKTGSALAESIVCEGDAAGAPRVEVVAILENFFVEGSGEVVDENPSGAALVE